MQCFFCSQPASAQCFVQSCRRYICRNHAAVVGSTVGCWDCFGAEADRYNQEIHWVKSTLRSRPTANCGICGRRVVHWGGHPQFSNWVETLNRQTSLAQRVRNEFPPAVICQKNGCITCVEHQPYEYTSVKWFSKHDTTRYTCRVCGKSWSG